MVPECIIVGLGYAGENLDYGKLRQWDLAPMPLENATGESGHAAEFLQTLEQQIVPFVEREYRADPAHRVLAGSSLGGLFTLYAMYARPGLFEGYIAVSPAVWHGPNCMLDFDRKFARAKKPLPARLFLSGAENEWPLFRLAISRYAQQLTQRRYAGFKLETRLIDGMRHSGTKAEGYARGMQFVFAPMAPESGPMQSHPY